MDANEKILALVQSILDDEHGIAERSMEYVWAVLDSFPNIKKVVETYVDADADFDGATRFFFPTEQVPDLVALYKRQ